MSTRKPSSAAHKPQRSGTTAQWPALTVTLHSWTIGALPILNHFLERMRLEAILQAHLPAGDGRGKLPVARGNRSRVGSLGFQGVRERR